MSPSYRAIVLFIRLLVRIFFRRVEVTGLDNVPEKGGGLLIAWHPNALVDPALVFASFPRPVVVGARHGLFRVPLLGSLMRRLGCVPIYRAADAGGNADPEARRAANRQSLEAMARAVADGSLALLFPEGDSHDAPHPLELKAGAARLFERARELAAPGAPPPVVLPVGLYYDRKGAFGSRALVAIHPPLALPGDLATPPPADASEALRRERVARLTALFEKTLEEVVYATDSWELNRLMHRARGLVRAERAHRAGVSLRRADMAERTLGFARLWTGYRARSASHPQETRELLLRVQAYDQELAALGLSDRHLDGDPPLGTLTHLLHLALLSVLVYLVLPPLLVVGYLIHLPAALALAALGRRFSRRAKDEATLKLLLGAVAFPATWALTALLVVWGENRLAAAFPRVPQAPGATAVLTVLLCILGGLTALHYHRLLEVTRHGLRVRLTRARRRDAVARLRAERARLHDAILALAQGLALPGAVAPDGRIVAAPEAASPGG